MKIGDYVGWPDHDVDDVIIPAGIIIEIKPHENVPQWQSHAEYLVLLDHNGELSWEHGSDLKVMNENR